MRDLDYVRQLLMEMEAEGDYALRVITSDVSEKEMNHILIMADAGLLSQVDRHSYRISWHGYDYLDAVRDEENWSKTKAALNKIGGGTFEIAKELAVAYLKQTAKEKLGIEL